MRGMKRDQWLRQHTRGLVAGYFLVRNGIGRVSLDAEIECDVVVGPEVETGVVIECLADLGESVIRFEGVVPEEPDDAIDGGGRGVRSVGRNAVDLDDLPGGAGIRGESSADLRFVGAGPLLVQ